MSLTTHIARDGFRLRGAAMSRIDGFSDVVFGFALTLIVVSLEVPKTFDEMERLLRGFIPFGICFVFLMMVWMTHFRFFRRFGLHDLATIVINAALLFTILFYVYPLKFLFTIATVGGSEPGKDSVSMTAHQGFELMVLYGGGFSAIYFLLMLLNLNAWRHRKELDLNPLELLILKSETCDLAGVMLIGLLSCAVAAVLIRSSPQNVFMAGFTFFLIGVWKTISGSYFGKRIRAERQTMPPEELHPVH